MTLTTCPSLYYPEYYTNWTDDHEFLLAEEQTITSVEFTTAESPGYITESDPEEDPEGYEDDETEDGPVDYPMDGGDDGDDDDGDSSRDDARDEDEDEEDEHLAPADSTTVIPADEPVFPPEGTEPAIPPPSTDITIGARITVRPQTSISLPPEAEVERLLAMTTPSPSPPISLSPPSAGERLTLRIASTQALINAVTAALPPPPLTTHTLHSTISIHTITCSRYEIGESSTARPARGQGIDYGFVSTVDAEERRQGIRDVGYGIRDTWVDQRRQYLYALLEDAQDSRSRISQRVDMNSTSRDLIIGCLGPDGRGSSSHQKTMRRENKSWHLKPEEDQTLPVNGHQPKLHDPKSAPSGVYDRPKSLRKHSTNGDGSHRAEGVVGLTRWIDKMESQFSISGLVPLRINVKFSNWALCLVLPLTGGYGLDMNP
ncbi:hypothetical protein Tco_0228561 [Tanacetum coccineum]